MLKIGDRIKVKGKIIPKNWFNTWESEMDEAIGKEGFIIDIKYDGYKLDLENDPEQIGTFTYPEDSLEKIEE